jgi:hypothetical protein
LQQITGPIREAAAHRFFISRYSAALHAVGNTTSSLCAQSARAALTHWTMDLTFQYLRIIVC